MKITSDTDRNAFITRVLAVDLNKHPWEFSAKPYDEPKKDRSLSQNRLAFKWYAELGKQSGNGKDHERNFCKWTYGCNILAESDPDGEFTKFYSKLMDNYNYEECLAAMEFVQITSLMKVKQMAEYLNHIELYAGERGYKLTHPDDLYWDALMKDNEVR